MAMLTTLCAMLAFGPVTLPPPTGDAAAPPPSLTVPHVRALSRSAQSLLDEALLRSATIARLVRVLQDYRVFVLVDTRIDPAVPTGQTALLAATPGGRYVQVVLNPALMHDRRIELLGHELQHALEIASTDEVQDGSSLRLHFTAIGRRLGTAGQREASFETDAARDVELQVRRDLAARTQIAI